jgi:hypothetical protein
MARRNRQRPGDPPARSQGTRSSSSIEVQAAGGLIFDSAFGRERRRWWAMGEFVPGLQLNADFYTEVVGPLLERWPHAAARLGSGSEVLGFDTERSTDHGWGPRLIVLASADSLETVSLAIEARLPDTFRGWPVRYGWDDHPVSHHVRVATLSHWISGELGVDTSEGLRGVDWLLMPQQKLLEVTSGAVYRDDTGALGEIRRRLAWYPESVWLWMLAAQWRRISQEESFVGRTAEVGDELGSRLVTARLTRELMRLWFLLHRTYWPYTKWFGSAFARLPDSADLAAALGTALGARAFSEREAGLISAYQLVADRHNAVGLTNRVDPDVRPYYGRPYQVLMADRFTEACLERVTDPELADLPLVGSVDQVADSTDLLSVASRARRLETLFRGAPVRRGGADSWSATDEDGSAAPDGDGV